MGYPMAVQLRRKIPPTSKLCIFDVNEVVLHQFANETGEYGPIKVASNSREVAELSDFIISIVPEGTHVRTVYLEPEVGMLAAEDTSGKLFIDW